MNYRRVLLLVAVLLVAVLGQRPRSVSAGDDWLPISPDELKMTSVPEAPGAPAIYSTAKLTATILPPTNTTTCA